MTPRPAPAGITPVVSDTRSLTTQVAERLREAIVEGHFARGEQLPSEEQLSASYRVGRTTVREALKILDTEGVVQVRRGRGWFVSSARPVKRPITRLESVTDLLAAQGYTVVNRLLAVDIRTPTDEEAEALDLPRDARVTHLERLRLAGGEPLIYSVDVFPADVLPGTTDGTWQGSLFLELERAGLTLTTAVSSFHASRLPPAAQLACGLDPALPWLLMIQLNRTEDGRPIIYSHDYHRGDRFSFDVLRRAEPKGGPSA